MMDPLIDFLCRAEHVLPLLLLRASFILVMALGTAFLFRKHAALNRLVWMSAISVVLLLPATLPVEAWRFPTKSAVPAVTEVAEVAATESPSPASDLILPIEIGPVSALGEEAAIPAIVHRPKPAAVVAQTVRLPWISMLWAMGCVLGCIYLLVGRLAIWNLRSRRTEIDAKWGEKNPHRLRNCRGRRQISAEQ